jgi:diguanylate cyclase (GGDEF)-like protein
MLASSLTLRLTRRFAVKEWAWWHLPPVVRCYVGAVPFAALAVMAVAASHTEWRLDDLVKFLLLVCCGMISVASTPRMMYSVNGGLVRDFSSIWTVPAAILLPPVYAAMAPIAFSAAMYLFVHRGIPHRQVFTAAAQSLSYAGASAFFRLLPDSFAGGSVGVGLHAFTWCAAVAACEIIGNRGHHFLIMGAVKLSSPQVRILKVELDREGAQALFVEMDLGILITLAVAISPALIVIAVPTVLLVRRFLVFPILSAQSRVDSKTGLLNVSTWEAEAESEISRAIRTRNPVALCLVDIDHFKLVNDTHGHLVGDKVLKAVAEGLTTQSRDYDRAGRFGGEEFVLLLAQTTEADALKIAERLRAHVESLAIPVDDRPGSPVVTVTISIGVTALARGETRELIDLLAAADSALYAAKQGGRNQVAAVSPHHNMGLDDFNADLAATSRPRDDARPGADTRPGPGAQSPRAVQVQVQAKPTPLSLCQTRSLSVLVRAPHEFDLHD